jgi:NAD(P)-dependent dehydrogenase (short-subunit alcohol dehydrogenase family)
MLVKTFFAFEKKKIGMPQRDFLIRRIDRPEDITNAIANFTSKQAGWLTGQLLFVHGDRQMLFGGY